MNWNLELMPFSNRVGIFLALMDDPLSPSTGEHQALHLELDYPNAHSDRSRRLALVKWWVAIPTTWCCFFLDIAAFVVVIALAVFHLRRVIGRTVTG